MALDLFHGRRSRLVCNGESRRQFGTRRRSPRIANASGFIRFDHRPKFKTGDKFAFWKVHLRLSRIYDGMPDHDRVGILLDLLGRKVRVLLDAEAIAAPKRDAATLNQVWGGHPDCGSLGRSKEIKSSCKIKSLSPF